MMVDQPKYWRDAATLIIAAKKDGRAQVAEEFDYNILMLQRSSKVKFSTNLHVFPGGVASAADSNSGWSELFHRVTGKLIQDIRRELGCSGSRPPVLCDDVTIDNRLSRVISMRITAIRETFEETGILLLTPAHVAGKLSHKAYDSCNTSSDDLASWRSKVTMDASAFLDLCNRLNAVPNVWALVEWSNWLTPVSYENKMPSLKPKRYDTMFFICTLSNQPRVDVDNGEIVHAVWDTPDNLIFLNSVRKLSFIDPQRYELLRMCNFSVFENLSKFSRERAVKGVLRFSVVVVMCADGSFILYPGDDMYPDAPDLYGERDLLVSDKTVSESRTGVCNFNRFEQTGDGSVIFCNLKDFLGHGTPANEDEVVKKVYEKQAHL